MGDGYPPALHGLLGWPVFSPSLYQEICPTYPKATVTMESFTTSSEYADDDLPNLGEDHIPLDVMPPLPESGQLSRQSSCMWLQKHSLMTSMSSLSSSQDTVKYIPRDPAMEAFSVLNVAPSFDSDPGNFSMDMDRKVGMDSQDSDGNVYKTIKDSHSLDSSDAQEYAGNASRSNLCFLPEVEDGSEDYDTAQQAKGEDINGGELVDGVKRVNGNGAEHMEEEFESSTHYDTGIETDMDLDDLSSHSGQGVSWAFVQGIKFSSTKHDTVGSMKHEDAESENGQAPITLSTDAAVPAVLNCSQTRVSKMSSWDSKYDLSSPFNKRQAGWSNSEFAGSNEAVCGNSLSSIATECQWNDISGPVEDMELGKLSDLPNNGMQNIGSFGDDQSLKRSNAKNESISSDVKDSHVNPFKKSSFASRDGVINLDATAGSLEVQQILECVNNRLHSTGSVDSVPGECTHNNSENADQESNMVDDYMLQLQLIEEEDESETEEEGSGTTRCTEQTSYSGENSQIKNSKEEVDDDVFTKSCTSLGLMPLPMQESETDVIPNARFMNDDVEKDSILNPSSCKIDNCEGSVDSEPAQCTENTPFPKTSALPEKTDLPVDATKMFVPIKRGKPPNLRFYLGSSVEQSDATVDDTTEDEMTYDDWMGASINSLIASANEGIFFNSLNMPLYASSDAWRKKTGPKDETVNAAIHDTVSQQLQLFPRWNSQDSDSQADRSGSLPQPVKTEEVQAVESNGEILATSKDSTLISPRSLALTTKQFLSELESVLSGETPVNLRHDQSVDMFPCGTLPMNGLTDSSDPGISDELCVTLDTIGKRTRNLQQQLINSLAREELLRHEKAEDESRAVKHIERLNKEVEVLRVENHKLYSLLSSLQSQTKKDHSQTYQLENIILQLHHKIQQLENRKAKLKLPSNTQEIMSNNVSTQVEQDFQFSRGTLVKMSGMESSDKAVQVEPFSEECGVQTVINQISDTCTQTTSTNFPPMPYARHIINSGEPLVPNHSHEDDMNKLSNNELVEGPEKWRHLSTEPLTSDPAFLELQRSLASAIMQHDMLQLKLTKSTKDSMQKSLEVKKSQSELMEVRNTCELQRVKYDGDLIEMDLLKDKLAMFGKNLACAEADNVHVKRQLKEAERRVLDYGTIQDKCQEQAKDLACQSREVASLQMKLADAKAENGMMGEQIKSLSGEVKHYLEVLPAIKMENAVLKEKLTFITTEKQRLQEELSMLQKNCDESLGKMNILETSLADTRSEKKLLHTEVLVLRDEYEYMKKVVAVMEKYFKLELPSQSMHGDDSGQQVTESFGSGHQTDITLKEELQKLRNEYENISSIANDFKFDKDPFLAANNAAVGRSSLQTEYTSGNVEVLPDKSRTHDSIMKKSESVLKKLDTSGSICEKVSLPSAVNLHDTQKLIFDDLVGEFGNDIEIVSFTCEKQSPSEQLCSEKSTVKADELPQGGKLLWMLQEVEKELHRQDGTTADLKGPGLEPINDIEIVSYTCEKQSSCEQLGCEDLPDKSRTHDGTMQKSESVLKKLETSGNMSGDISFPLAVNLHDAHKLIIDDLACEFDDDIEIVSFACEKPSHFEQLGNEKSTVKTEELPQGGKLLWMLQEVEKELHRQDGTTADLKGTSPKPSPTSLENGCESGDGGEIKYTQNRAVKHTENESVVEENARGQKKWYKDVNMEQLEDDYEALRKRRLNMLLQAYTGGLETDDKPKDAIHRDATVSQCRTGGSTWQGPIDQNTGVNGSVLYEEELHEQELQRSCVNLSKSWNGPVHSRSLSACSVDDDHVSHRKSIDSNYSQETLYASLPLWPNKEPFYQILPRPKKASSPSNKNNDVPGYPANNFTSSPEVARAKSWLKHFHQDHEELDVYNSLATQYGSESLSQLRSGTTSSDHGFENQQEPVTENSPLSSMKTSFLGGRNDKKTFALSMAVGNIAEDDIVSPRPLSPGTSLSRSLPNQSRDVHNIHRFSTPLKPANVLQSAEYPSHNAFKSQTDRCPVGTAGLISVVSNPCKNRQYCQVFNDSINDRSDTQDYGQNVHNFANASFNHSKLATRKPDELGAETVCKAAYFNDSNMSLNPQWDRVGFKKREVGKVSRDEFPQSKSLTREGKMDHGSHHWESDRDNCSEHCEHSHQTLFDTAHSDVGCSSPEADLVVTRSGDIVQRTKEQYTDVSRNKQKLFMSQSGIEMSISASNPRYATDTSDSTHRQPAVVSGDPLISALKTTKHTSDSLSPEQRKYADTLIKQYTQWNGNSSPTVFQSGTSNRLPWVGTSTDSRMEPSPLQGRMAAEATMSASAAKVAEAMNYTSPVRLDNDSIGEGEVYTEACAPVGCESSQVHKNGTKQVGQDKFSKDISGSSNFNEAQRLYIDELINKYTKQWDERKHSQPVAAKTSL